MKTAYWPTLTSFDHGYEPQAHLVAYYLSRGMRELAQRMASRTERIAQILGPIEGVK